MIKKHKLGLCLLQLIIGPCHLITKKEECCSISEPILTVAWSVLLTIAKHEPLVFLQDEMLEK